MNISEYQDSIAIVYYLSFEKLISDSIFREKNQSKIAVWSHCKIISISKSLLAYLNEACNRSLSSIVNSVLLLFDIEKFTIAQSYSCRIAYIHFTKRQTFTLISNMVNTVT